MWNYEVLRWTGEKVMGVSGDIRKRGGRMVVRWCYALREVTLRDAHAWRAGVAQGCARSRNIKKFGWTTQQHQQKVSNNKRVAQGILFPPLFFLSFLSVGFSLSPSSCHFLPFIITLQLSLNFIIQ